MLQLEIIPILHNSGLLQLNFQNTKHSNKINISNCAPFNTVRECRRKAHRTMLLYEYKFKKTRLSGTNGILCIIAYNTAGLYGTLLKCPGL